MEKIKVKKLRAAAVLCIIFIAVAGIFVRSNYVFLAHKPVKRAVEEIDVSLGEGKISELNKCTELKNLIAVGTDNDRLSKFTVFDKLETFYMFVSWGEEISDIGMAAINKQPSLKELSFLRGTVDLSALDNDSVEKLILFDTNAENLRDIAKCSRLKELTVSISAVDDFIVPAENGGDLDFMLIDSTVFSELDNIEKLSFSGVGIGDISGFSGMASLRELTVSEGALSESDRSALEEIGIKVNVYD